MARPFTRLALLRAKKGLTQAQLAERSGVSLSVVSAIETGRSRRPQLRSLSRLAHALEIDVRDLFDEEEIA